MDFSSYKTWERIGVAVVAVFFLIYLFAPSCDNSCYHDDETEKYYEHQEKTSTPTIENEYPDSWMVGKWRTRLSSMYGTMIVTLEIDEYGNTFETIEYSNGGYERNSFKMYYDRDSQQLYFKNGSLTTHYNVYPSSRRFGDGEMMFSKY